MIQTFDGVEMALVPPGCFSMGNVNGRTGETPVHTVCLDSPYWIDVYEVTYGQFPGGPPDCPPQSTASEDLPRACVTWVEATAHCEDRGGRLPTEAEWEYAARGPDGLIYPWGNEFVDANLVWLPNSNNQALPVGSRPGGVSWVGAYDLSGNVREWVNDWFDQDYYSTLPSEVTNPQGPDEGTQRGVRGGSFIIDGEQGVSSTFRFRGGERPTSWESYTGFRCMLPYTQ